MARSPAAAAQRSAGTATQWVTGPARPRLDPQELHVWLADLRTVDDAVRGSLSTQERARAEAIADSRTRALWALSRGMLRALLGRYLQRAPASLQIVDDERGKPSVARASRTDESWREPHFSLSHSGPFALYGFAAEGPLGVDIQLARGKRRSCAGEHPQRDHVGIARRAFGEREADRLGSLSPSLREGEFLRLWTRYEAESKYFGGGIGGKRARPGDPWVRDLDLKLECTKELPIGAVAAGAPCTLRLWLA